MTVTPRHATTLRTTHHRTNSQRATLQHTAAPHAPHPHPTAMVPANTPVPRPRPKLSKREVEVLVVWLAHDSKEQAAQQLFLSSSTVNTHIARIRTKYRIIGRPAPSKTALLIRALQDGYCNLEQLAPDDPAPGLGACVR